VVVTIRHLLLLRHAKSSWDDPHLADHDRPLSERGRRAAVAVRDHLARVGTMPELVLCSSAVRTVQTLELIRPSLPAGTAVEIDPELYGADSGELLARLRQVSTSVRSTMLIGHNPGIENLAASLVGTGDDTARMAMRSKFPTAAIAHLAIEHRWSALAPRAATLEQFWTPR
jgi:phosphohistidine phosphatase